MDVPFTAADVAIASEAWTAITVGLAEELDDVFTCVSEFGSVSDPMASGIGIVVFSADCEALVLVSSRLGQATATSTASKPAIKLVVFILANREQAGIRDDRNVFSTCNRENDYLPIYVLP